ncbi:PepSY domain-containing protein [Crocosphaera sp. Alani8]|uniref:PepSY domain-containing protein n=1 Tax=Crocosphaera sp. Alani8 TaxID=3038952 RepID=UPI00313DB3AF
MKSQLIALFSAFSFFSTIGLSSCGTQSNNTTTPTAQEPATTVEETTPVREGAESSVPGAVSREEAEQVALEAVGSGQVTWSAPEEDRGAAWEVEITQADGSEVDVLVAPDGTVIKQVEKAGSGPALSGPGPIPADGVISEDEAKQAALDYLGEGQVTWISREDERGATWEVEITRPNGSELDVLVAGDGTIVQ